MAAVPVGPAPQKPQPVKRHGAGQYEDNWLRWFVGASSFYEFFDVEGWNAMTTTEKASYVKTEVALGITICFAQIPESVAFAFMAHIKPPVAIHAAWVVGLICSLFGGRTGMVNGAEGAFAAIIATLIPEPTQPGGNGEGIELLFPSVMVCGCFMLLIWLTGSYRFISLVPASVMLGFCNGLAIVIGWSQLHPFQEGHGDHKHWVGGSKLWCMTAEMMTAMLIMEFVPKIPLKVAKLLPSSLLAIISSVIMEFAIVRPAGGRTDVIGDVQKFTLTYPYPFFLNSDYDMSLIQPDDMGKILIQGILLAVAGIVQGLLTTEVVYDFLKTPTNTNAVCLSCGVANVISGFLGGMGGDAMIGLSTINCLNGGKGRLGPTVTALGIAICMFGGYPLLNFIPVASLAGVMIVVVLHTFKWFSVPMVISAFVPESARKPLHLPERVDRWDMMIVAIVTTLVVVLNLVYAVGVGLVLASLRYAWETSQELVIEEAWHDGAKVYYVRGSGFFDPLGFTKAGDEQGFDKLRASEIKHGRVAMMASVGLLGQHFIKFPGFDQTPAGLGAVGTGEGVIGFFGVFLLSGVLELAWRERDGVAPGNFGDPLGFKMYDNEMRNREINNGRFAMICVLGIFLAELASGKDAIQQFGL